MQPRPDPRLRRILAHLEHASRGLDLGPAHQRATNALASVASPKYIEWASFSTPRVPEGVIAHPSAPQFSSSQAVICV
jgi:hypothetical protein